jgi:hypothetical protein
MLVSTFHLWHRLIFFIFLWNFPFSEILHRISQKICFKICYSVRSCLPNFISFLARQILYSRTSAQSTQGPLQALILPATTAFINQIIPISSRHQNSTMLYTFFQDLGTETTKKEKVVSAFSSTPAKHTTSITRKAPSKHTVSSRKSVVDS